MAVQLGHAFRDCFPLLRSSSCLMRYLILDCVATVAWRHNQQQVLIRWIDRTSYQVLPLRQGGCMNCLVGMSYVQTWVCSMCWCENVLCAACMSYVQIWVCSMCTCEHVVCGACMSCAQLWVCFMWRFVYISCADLRISCVQILVFSYVQVWVCLLSRLEYVSCADLRIAMCRLEPALCAGLSIRNVQICVCLVCRLEYVLNPACD